LVQQTAHANDGASNFSATSRVSRLLTCLVRRGRRDESRWHPRS